MTNSSPHLFPPSNMCAVQIILLLACIPASVVSFFRRIDLLHFQFVKV